MGGTGYRCGSGRDGGSASVAGVRAGVSNQLSPFAGGSEIG